MNSEGVRHRSVVTEVLNAALGAVNPYTAVLEALRSPQIEEDIEPYKRVHVIGAGKAGAAMARACEEALGERIAGGLVIVKEGHALAHGQPHGRVEIVEAGHPVPDRRGEEATARLLDIAGSAGSDDLLICLISGGGSALLVSPAEGISLDDTQATTQLMLRAGATINELNAVRKHISRIAGGQLARAASSARVLSFILSDVVGSPVDVIASGPTAPDPTTYAEALSILEHYGLAELAPEPVISRLRRGAAGEVPETPKPGDPLFSTVSNNILASNVTAVEASAAYARTIGLNTAIISTYVEGEAREVGLVIAGVGKEIVAQSRPLACPACVLFGGETTVTVKGLGTGGRNTELALSAAIALDGLGPDLVVASFATDGGDGTAPCAGAIADGTTIERAKLLGLDARAALAGNDSYSFWEALGDAIVTGPTGTNVNDIMAVFAF
jgi:glycerate 2-kinase